MKAQFYVTKPSGGFWNPYETFETGIVEGTKEEIQSELQARVDRTWSPYVTHDYKIIDDAPEAAQE